MLRDKKNHSRYIGHRHHPLVSRDRKFPQKPLDESKTHKVAQSIHKREHWVLFSRDGAVAFADLRGSGVHRTIRLCLQHLRRPGPLPPPQKRREPISVQLLRPGPQPVQVVQNQPGPQNGLAPFVVPVPVPAQGGNGDVGVHVLPQERPDARRAAQHDRPEQTPLQRKDLLLRYIRGHPRPPRGLREPVPYTPGMRAPRLPHVVAPLPDHLYEVQIQQGNHGVPPGEIAEPGAG
mmetsp:Transcript_81569/g.218280  ORF Transcript_81569/g.218280 Transcript_81569/m.218280 type:complete len:234 (+) Transcript_81569:576-1277(+)